MLSGSSGHPPSAAAESLDHAGKLVEMERSPAARHERERFRSQPEPRQILRLESPQEIGVVDGVEDRFLPRAGRPDLEGALKRPHGHGEAVDAVWTEKEQVLRALLVARHSVDPGRQSIRLDLRDAELFDLDPL